MESLFGTGEGGREGSSEHCEGSSEHYRDLGTEVGVAVRERRIIGPLCYFLIFVKILPGSLDHWSKLELPPHNKPLLHQNGEELF